MAQVVWAGSRVVQWQTRGKFQSILLELLSQTNESQLAPLAAMDSLIYRASSFQPIDQSSWSPSIGYCHRRSNRLQKMFPTSRKPSTTLTWASDNSAYFFSAASSSDNCVTKSWASSTLSRTIELLLQYSGKFTHLLLIELTHSYLHDSHWCS